MSESTIPDARQPTRDGTIIAGRYKVDKLIARGGMATVYLAQHVKLNRPVALKVLTPPPDSEEAASFEERFRLEGETLAQLDHPNIVTLHDFGELEKDGRFFLAMEYIDGPRLSDLLKDGPLPVDRALTILVQVCSALRYAHRRGVVHRDLKPSNLLIKQDDEGNDLVKVVDFGLVKLTRDDQSITRAGLILGSPHCMSPEQVKGLEIDHRADIYAIGVLLFRSITGQYPFHGPNSAATMIAHLNQEVPTFFSAAPELQAPEGLEDIVRRCLAKSPADRFADMGALIDALAACIELPPEAFRSVAQSQPTMRSQDLRTPAPVAGSTSSGVGRGVGVAAVVAVLAAVLLVGGLLVGAVVGGVIGTAGQPRPPEPAPVAAPEPLPEPAPVELAAEEPAPSDDAPDGAEATEEGAGSADEPDVPEEPPVEVAPAPRPRPRPRPRPAPAPVAAPAPAPQPVAAPEPAPQPAPEAEKGDGDDAPEGYMGMPDDLFE